MDVGTAKVESADRSRVPHHGLDLVDPDEPFTAADYRAHALAALRDIGRRGKGAVLVGGTGLYLRVVARGIALDEVPPDPILRAELDERLAEDGLAALVTELRRLAPTVAARIDAANPRSVIRALERARGVGDRPPGEPVGYGARTLWLGVQLSGEAHRRRIAARAAAQFGGGLLEEAERLLARYDRALPAFSAFGYREAFAHLAGELTFDDAIERTVRRTTAYARRQRIWFRKEPDVTWLDGDARAASRAAELGATFLGRNPRPS
jgi:tRNA dimethylallyltransferase